MSTSDPSEIIKQLRGGGVAMPLNSKSLGQSPREWYQPFLTNVADLIESLTHDRDEARDEADSWRQQAWMEGYPRDSSDRHPWETSDEYRVLLAAGWVSPTPRLPPVAPSPDTKGGEQ